MQGQKNSEVAAPEVHKFDGVSDKFARNKGIFHSWGAVGFAVAYNRRVVNKTLTTTALHFSFNNICKLFKMMVARQSIAVWRSDSNIWLAPVLYQ